MHEPPSQSYEFGPYRVDARRRLLLRDGATVPLTSKAFDLLRTLVENSGRVLEKDELMRRLWPDTVVEENNLSVNMSALRKALGESAGEHRYIATIPGRGYQFVAAVNRTQDAADEPLVVERLTRTRIIAEEEVDGVDEPGRVAGLEPLQVGGGSGGRRINRGARLALSVAGAVLILGIVSGLLYFSGLKNEGAESAFKSIAILPFQPMVAGASDDEYLRLGMADALITKLSNLRDISVRPTSAVRKYAYREIDTISIGRELGVDSVLEGSIQQSGGQLRVTVQLVSVPEGRPLWAETFDERLQDIFTVQDQVAEHIVRALALKLTGEEHSRMLKDYTPDRDAYDLYLRGRDALERRTGEDVQRALRYFQQAAGKDPDFALAYAGLSDANVYLPDYDLIPPEEAHRNAKAMAKKALALDDTLGEVHTSLANILRDEWDFSGSEEEIRKAIKLKPNYAEAHHIYSHLLLDLGRTEESLRESTLNLQFDPHSTAPRLHMGQHFIYARQYDEAISQLLEALKIDPNYSRAYLYISHAYEQKGMSDEAVAAYLKSKTLGGAGSEEIVRLKKAYEKGGMNRFWREELAQTLEREKRKYVAPYNIALLYGRLGEADKAFEWLEKAYIERTPLLVALKSDHEFDALRSDPRFASLVKRVGLPQ